MWLVKWYVNCDLYKVKVGWYLSVKNKVLVSKFQGEYNLVDCKIS